MQVKVFIILLSCLTLVSCREKSVPKPTGYFRIDFPEKSYHPWRMDYPFSFDIPDYAVVLPDQGIIPEPFWINVDIPGNKARIHISYKRVRNDLSRYTEESRKLAYDHTIRASSIDEELFLNPGKRVFGTIYHINGNAASPLQFYLTDSLHHFLRGALYIRATPNIDSLKPVIEFLKTDVVHLIGTMEWNDHLGLSAKR